MANVGEIKARLVLENAEFKRRMAESREQLNTMSSSAQSAKRSLTDIQNASLAVGAAVVAGMGTTVAVAANFEKAMSRVKAVSGATDEQFLALKDAAMEMGKTTQFSSTQAAEALTYLSMAGFEVEDQINALPAVLNAAAAGNIDLGRSADIVSNIMTGFGIKATDTGEAVDVLVKTMTTANTDLPMLGEAMKYVAPVASSLGLGIEETAAAIAKMSDAGIQGGQAGTSLRAALLSLANPVGQTKDAMDEFGIKVLDAEGNMKPIPELVGHIAEKMEGMTDAQKTATAAQLVGVEAASGFVTLLGIGEEGLRDYTKELENAGGTADRVAKTQMDNLLGSFEEFKSALEGLGIEIGEEFLPEFRAIVETGTDIVGMLGELDPATFSVGLKMAGAAAGVALVGSSIAKLIGSLRVLMVSMGPAGWVITGLSILAGVLVGVKEGYDEMNTVNLEHVNQLSKERDELSNTINEYDALKNKLQLTNDELGRYVDINSEMSKTTDPDAITRLKDEQEKLREKSGLTNEQLERLVELNGDIVEAVPETNTKLTDQGNILIDNTEAAKKYNDEQLELIRLELEAQKAKAEANLDDYLEKEHRILDKMNESRQKSIDLEKDIQDQVKYVADLEEDLATAKEEDDTYEIDRLNNLIAREDNRLNSLKKQKAKHAEIVVEQTKELDKVQEQIGKLDEVKRKMIEVEMKQVGINAKRGEEVNQINSAISKLQKEKEQLDKNTPVAQKKTDAYKEAVRQIDKQIDELGIVKDRIGDIIGEAKVMNYELSKDVEKQVQITQTTRTRQIIERGVESATGPRQMKHNGGLVGDGLPKLHSGGLASRLSQPPSHNEIDVRLLRNEMVLTETQQSQLFDAIDAGLLSQSSDSQNPSEGKMEIHQTNHFQQSELSPSEIAKKNKQMLRELAYEYGG